jgi:hypothetical protein
MFFSIITLMISLSVATAHLNDTEFDKSKCDKINYTDYEKFGSNC